MSFSSPWWLLTLVPVAALAVAYDEAEAAQRRYALAEEALELAVADARAALILVEEGREPLLRGIQGESEAAAARAATLNDQRVRAGTSATIDQLDIERQRLSAAIAVAQAKAQLTTSYIAVQKSLGLGWTPQRADAVPPAR